MRWAWRHHQEVSSRWISVISIGVMGWPWICTTHRRDATHRSLTLFCRPFPGTLPPLKRVWKNSSLRRRRSANQHLTQRAMIRTKSIQGVLRKGGVSASEKRIVSSTILLGIDISFWWAQSQNFWWRFHTRSYSRAHSKLHLQAFFRCYRRIKCQCTASVFDQNKRQPGTGGSGWSDRKEGPGVGKGAC